MFLIFTLFRCRSQDKSLGCKRIGVFNLKLKEAVSKPNFTKVVASFSLRKLNTSATYPSRLRLRRGGKVAATFKSLLMRHPFCFKK